MTQVLVKDYPNGPSCLTFGFAKEVNAVGKLIPNGVLIADLLEFEKNIVPVWTAFLGTIKDTQVDAICSLLRYIVEDHHFFPGMTVGKLRNMSYKELCTTKIVDQRAAFLVNVFTQI